MIFLVLKTLGLAAAIFAGVWTLFFGSQRLANAFNGSKADKFLNPPVTPYNYKESELWEAPVYWTNWKTTPIVEAKAIITLSLS